MPIQIMRDLKVKRDKFALHFMVVNTFYKAKPDRTRFASASMYFSSRQEYHAAFDGGSQDPVHIAKVNVANLMQKQLLESYWMAKNELQREPRAREVIVHYHNRRQAEVRPKVMIFDLIDQYVEVNRLEEGTKRVYNAMKLALKTFLRVKMSIDNIDCMAIDKTFLYRFEIQMLQMKSPRTGRVYQKSSLREYTAKLQAVLDHGVRIGEVKKEVTENYETSILKKDKIPDRIINDIKEAIQWKIHPNALRKIEINAPMGWAVSETNVQAFHRERILFLFQTWSGMSFGDMEKIGDVRPSIREDLSGNRSMFYNRKKTGELAIIPIWDETIKILEQLHYDVTPRVSLKTYNNRIRNMLKYYDIELLDEIDKKGGSHLGRHLFGSRMLVKGMSMEAVSRMMGHSSIEVTQTTYASVDITKITADFNRVNALTHPTAV